MPHDLSPAVYSKHPSRLVLEQIADKWSVLIIGALCRGPLRFNALKREVDGVTQKALTQTLRRLERIGLVERRVIPVSPIAVEYSVTELGESLKVPFQALFAWSITHAPEIEAAIRHFEMNQEDVRDISAKAAQV